MAQELRFLGHVYLDPLFASSSILPAAKIGSPRTRTMESE
jgi:hypothetical protein